MARVCVVAVNVVDMDRSIDFYSAALGFKVEDRTHYPEIVQLEHDGIPFLLQKAAAAARVDYPRQAQSLLNFETDDIASAVLRLRKAGAEILHKEPQPCPVGVFVAFRDPSGNVHELVEFRETGA